MGNRILETRQMWVNGAKAQRAAQFPDGVMERMIDFNPEEETITIPTPQTAGLNTASQVEMISPTLGHRHTESEGNDY